MVNYRRYKFLGATCFFTVVLKDRQATTLTDHIDLFRKVVKRAQVIYQFEIKAMVVLPDHFHAIWELHDDSDDYSKILRFIKKIFTAEVVKTHKELTRNYRGEYNLWQRRFWDHVIRDERDYENHVNYIHYNPVKHGLVERVLDWPYSTFHRYVKQGILPRNWCADGKLPDIDNE